MMKKLAKKLSQLLLWPLGFELRRRSAEHVTPITSEWLPVFFYLNKMYARIRNLRGDVVECGVGRGRTFLFLAFLVQDEGAGRTLWGFDSFAGFPEPTAEDASPRNPQAGEKKSDRATILWMLRDAGITEEFLQNRIRLIPGFFETSLRAYDGPGIALLHIDADLYRSYRGVFEVLYPRVMPGGIVLLDEYRTPQYPGATRAVDEYLAGKSVAIEQDRRTGKYFFIKP